jgi:uncharacterized protein (DUF849 family)
VASALRAVRAAAPGVPVGITTVAWTAPLVQDRIAAIRSWTVLPDHASVNWHEPGAQDVAAALLERGVEVDVGLHSGSGSDAGFLGTPWAGKTRRVLVEITDLTARGAVSTAESFLQRLGSVSTPMLLHGEAAGAWPVLELAGRRGLDARIGLEDTLYLPDGEVAPGNGDLVTAAMERLRR